MPSRYAPDGALIDISELNPFELASMADCAGPDTSTSPGAQMLTRMRDAFLEAVEFETITLDDCDDKGQLHELADDIPSVYTHQAWSQFVDLGAWQEEPEYGEWPQDLTKTAMVALFQIAERLGRALYERWRDEWCCPICEAPYGEGCDPAECAQPFDEDYTVDITGDPLRVLIHLAEADAAGTRAEFASLWHRARIRTFRRAVWAVAAMVAVVAVLVVSAVVS